MSKTSNQTRNIPLALILPKPNNNNGFGWRLDIGVGYWVKYLITALKAFDCSSCSRIMNSRLCLYFDVWYYNKMLVTQSCQIV